jgi:quercetin dioxygenase-like cupin family protein
MSEKTETQRSAIVFNLADAPTHAMRYDRGTQIELFGPKTGAVNADVHINVINLDSGRGPYHYHERAENFYIVLDGKVEACVEGVRYFLEKDDVAFIPPGLRHYAGTAKDSTVPARVIEIYAPAGTDFNIVDDPAEVVDAVHGSH